MPVLTTILAIECACGPCSVALWQNGHILGELAEATPSSQSARLMPMIEQLLADSNLHYADLTHVACTVGPGSFTGIRVGLAAARGICFAAGIPGIGVTTLEATAYAARQEGKPVFAVLRAGKGEWYWQAFATQPAWQALGSPAVAAPEAIRQNAPKDAVWVGNVTDAKIPLIPSHPRASTLALLAAAKSNALPLTPLYIRAPDVTYPKQKV